LILGVGYIRGLFTLISLGPQISVIEHGVKRMDDILFNTKEQTSGVKHLTNDFSIRVENLSFSYVDEIKVLDNINFVVPQGTITALVGPSGGGKTTMAGLLSRFWDVDEGLIKIGGLDIKKIAKEDLYNKMSYVFQDSKLIKASIYENVLMGNPNAAREEVLTALHSAQCDDILKKFPNGMDTVIGTKSVYLSGGECQRVAIARAMLKNASIVILDEATAFADPENEHKVQKAFEETSSNPSLLKVLIKM